MADDFNLSNGNLEVLKTIPEMMNNRRWRRKIRMLVIDYKFNTPKPPKG